MESFFEVDGGTRVLEKSYVKIDDEDAITYSNLNGKESYEFVLRFISIIILLTIFILYNKFN